MERVGRMLIDSSRAMTSVVLLLLLLASQRHIVSGKLRGLSLRQGALHLPHRSGRVSVTTRAPPVETEATNQTEFEALDPALVRGILPAEEIAAFSRHAILSRRHLIRQYALSGIPQFGVSRLDPIAVPDMPLNFTMDVVELEGNITDGKASGLRDLQLLDVDVQLPGLAVAADIRIPLATLNAMYSLDGSFSGLFPLTGAGPLTLKLIDVDVKLIMQARLYYDRLHITRVDFTLAIANTTINLEGFLKDSGFGDVAQQFLDNMSGDFLRNFIKTFREERLPSLVMRGNKFLKDFEWRTLLPDMVAIYLGFDDESGSRYHKDFIPTITNNHLVDRIIRRLSHFLYGRRIGLPAQDIMATKKILFTWWVRTGIQLFRGHLFGAHNIKRVGDALISRHKEYFTFTIDVLVHHLKVAYKAQLVVLNRPVKFTLWAFISHLKMRVQVQLDAEYMDIYLTALDVLHIGKIDLKLAGLGPLELVANKMADKQINSDTTKRLLARMIARDARDAVAKTIRGVDINSILAETINGDVYARDPGIVFPDPEPEGNGTDFSSLLDSVLGADGDGDSGGLGSLLDLLLTDEGGDGAAENSTNDDLSDIDPELLAAFGLDMPLDDATTNGSTGGAASAATDSDSPDSEDPFADIDPELLAAFGLDSPADDAKEGKDSARGKDGDVEKEKAVVGTPSAAKDSDSEDPLADVDPELLAAFGLDSLPADGAKETTTAGGEARAAKASTASASKASLEGVDPDILALLGMDPDSADGSEGLAAAGAESPSGPTAAALELQQVLGRDGGAAGQAGLQIEADSSATAADAADANDDDGDSLFDADDNNSFFDKDSGASGAAIASDMENASDSLFDADDNNSFFDLRRRRG